MIRQRAAAAGILTRLSNHSFRYRYHRVPGRRRHAGKGGHDRRSCDLRTTRLYDRRGDQVTLDEIERIAI